MTQLQIFDIVDVQAPISWLDELAKQHGITFMMNGTEPDTKSRYITALYFTFTILTSVGFGNVAPVTNYEKVFTIFAMLLGCECDNSFSLFFK